MVFLIFVSFAVKIVLKLYAVTVLLYAILHIKDISFPVEVRSSNAKYFAKNQKYQCSSRGKYPQDEENWVGIQHSQTYFKRSRCKVSFGNPSSCGITTKKHFGVDY